MKINKASMVGLLWAFSATLAYSEISVSPKMEDVKEKIEDILKDNKPEDCLVAFDVDMTLVMTTAKEAEIPNIVKNKTEYKQIKGTLQPSEIDIMFNILDQVFENDNQKLIENDTPKIIQDLQKKGMKIIAITAALSGSLRNIQRIEAQRYQVLKDFGIDFSSSFPSLDDIEFKQFSKYLGHYPVFYKGILYANGESSGHSKGEVLIEFLKKSSFAPKIIFMVDDRRGHLEKVEKALKDFNPSIRFYGVEYTGGEASFSGDVSKEEFKRFWEKLASEARSIAAERVKTEQKAA